MRIFTKSLLTLALLCIAGVMNAAQETLVSSVDYAHPKNDHGQEVVGTYPYYWADGWAHDGAEAPAVVDDVLVLNFNGGRYDHVFIHDWMPVVGGAKYKIRITYKASVDGAVNVAFGNWGANMNKQSVPVTASGNWQDLDVFLGPAGFEANDGCHVKFAGGNYAGVLSIKKVEVYLVEPDPAPEGYMYNTFLMYQNGSPRANDWDAQAIYKLSAPLEIGANYVLKAKIKVDKAGDNQRVQLIPKWEASPNRDRWGGTTDVQYLDWKNLTTEFVEYTWNFASTWANDYFYFQFGKLDGNIYFDDISLKKEGSDVELVQNGSFSHWDLSSWSNNWGGPSYTEDSEVVLDPNYSPGGVTLADTDPVLIAHKLALQTAITKGKKANLEGKTIASRKALAAAIAVGQSIVNKAGGTLEDIDQARLDILNAVDELENRTAPIAEKEVAKGWKSVITNGNLESRDMSCFFSKVGGGDTENSVTYDYEGTDDFHAIVIETLGSKKTQNWDDQFFIRANEEIPGGSKIHVEFDYRSDVADNVESQVHNEPGAYIPASGIGNQSYKPEWQHFTYEGAASATFRTIAFNLSANGKDTKIVIDNIVFWVELPKAKKDLTVNGSFDGTAVPNVMVKVAPSNEVVPATATEGAGTDGSKGLKIEAPAKVTNDYETQMWIVSPYVLPAGTSVQVEFDYKADVAAKVATQAHEYPGNYIHYACAGDVEFTTEWKHFKSTFAVPSQCDGKPNNENTYNKDFRSIAFNMSMSAATTYYIDNVKLLVDEETVDQIIATGVQAVRPAAVSDGQYYDLQGRRVAQPVKGMYINNGRKVVVK